jgi:hypothetical protein
LKGTACPTNYGGVLNEAKMSNDELHTILYEQIYQYARTTTPVSIHPAIYYAHIASNRAGPHAVNRQSSTDGRGIHFDFCAAFTQQFVEKQHRAIRTAILLAKDFGCSAGRIFTPGGLALDLFLLEDHRDRLPPILGQRARLHPHGLASSLRVPYTRTSASLLGSASKPTFSSTSLRGSWPGSGASASVPPTVENPREDNVRSCCLSRKALLKVGS